MCILRRGITPSSIIFFALNFFAFIAVISSEKTTDIRGTLIIRNFNDDPKKQPTILDPSSFMLSNIKVSLNAGEFTTLTTITGAFIFPNVPVGVYSLDVLSITYVFSTMKLKVSDEGDSDILNITAIEYKYPGAKRNPTSYPLVLYAWARNEYFPVKPPFSIYGLIAGNPMILMMGFSVFVIVVFPMMLKNMVRL